MEVLILKGKGILNFFKVKKNSLDVFLNKKLTVEEKLDYALSELDDRAFKYKESLIDLVARRDTLGETVKEMEKKASAARKDAKNLKNEGKDALAKSKVAVMLSYEKALDDLKKTHEEVISKVDENKNVLIQIEAKKEVLAAQADVIKTKSNIAGVNDVSIDFEDISKLIRGLEIDVNARAEVEETINSTKPATDGDITSEKIDEAFKSL